MNIKSAVTSFVVALFISGCASSSVVYSPDELKYSKWLDELKSEMVTRGISQETIDKVYEQSYYTPDSAVVKSDRKQPEFAMTSTAYINRIVNKKRVEDGKKHLKSNQKLLKDIEKQYGVQPEYIIAFWGAETNYGQNFGSLLVVSSLTQLSYDQRRSAFFREQLYQVLKIIDTYNIDYNQVKGSWAGAMGHFQFMPSTFNNFAIDYNNDGSIDIWNSFEDAAGSAANYLSKEGWVKNQPWGMEVSLPWNFDFSQSGRKIQKTIKEWDKIGVRTANNKKLNLNKDWKASILIPEGRKGNAYLVLHNYKVIMKWNRSENYALAVGHLASAVKSAQPWKPIANESSLRLKTDDISKVQAFINKFFDGDLEEDGQLGEKTKEAIKQIQSKANMASDGYPDANLIRKIDNYDPKIGFVIPVPEQKLHKGR